MKEKEGRWPDIAYVVVAGAEKKIQVYGESAYCGFKT